MVAMKRDRKLSVVIAEDEYLISMDVDKAAREAGFDVAGIAANGEQALDLIRKHSPDAAIIDIKMPKMDGLEAARRIRDEMPIPVVIMTAYESPEFLEEAKEAGVGAYLIKPPDVSGISRAVELAVARHEDIMELRKLNAELRDALRQIKTMEGILPICSYCKKIHDEKGHWIKIEAYVHQHTLADFSHGVCPECLKEHFPEYSGKDKSETPE